jgi:hypothetical protein
VRVLNAAFDWLGWEHGELTDDLLLNYGLNLVDMHKNIACYFLSCSGSMSTSKAGEAEQQVRYKFVF